MEGDAEVLHAAYTLMELRNDQLSYLLTHDARGVYKHRRTGKFEVKVWDQTMKSSRKEYIWLGYHSLKEAAARTADKANIVMIWWRTRKTPEPSMLNYSLSDYDPCYLNKLKAMSKSRMIAKLRTEASGDSSGCAKGLVPPAKLWLRRAIGGG